ncbi:hypothetical protein D3C78_1073200 [compost metagenome]
MALGTEVVDLIWLAFLNDANQVAGVGQVTIMQDQIAIFCVWILIEVVDTVGVEGGRTTLDAVNDVALFQQKLREVGAVLSGHASNECNFTAHGVIPSVAKLRRLISDVNVNVDESGSGCGQVLCCCPAMLLE